MRAFIIKDGKPQLVDGPDMVHARLNRLFKTPISSLYGFINKGSRVLNYFNEKASKENVLAVITEVKMLIRMYEKNIQLKQIGARMFEPEDNKGNSALEVFVEYDVMGRRDKTIVPVRRR